MPFGELDLKQNKNEITTILINKVMSKKQVKKSYSAPTCTIIQVNEATDLMIETSMPGQHHPAHHGTGPSSAKAATMWQEEEEEDEQNSPSWND